MAVWSRFYFNEIQIKTFQNKRENSRHVHRLLQPGGVVKRNVIDVNKKSNNRKNMPFRGK